MAGSYGGQEAWWNKPAAEQPAQAAPTATPSPETRQPEAAVIERIVQQQMVTQAQEYQKWADERRNQYTAATTKFMADPALAAYYPIAEKYFLQMDTETGQKMPVGQLFDMTIRHVRSLKDMGVQAPKKAQGGFASGGQGWDSSTPQLDGNPQQGRFRSLDPEQVLKQKEDYLKQRRLDFELRKDRSTPQDQLIDQVVGRATQSMLDLHAAG